MDICTITDKGYLFKSLAQYYSLVKSGSKFTWWVLTMDKESLEILKKLKLNHTKIFSSADVETKEILATKSSRTPAEYCWTMKPNWIKYLFATKNLTSVLYADSDMYFFSSSEEIENQTNGYNIAISGHNFPAGMENRTEKSGIFNAGLVWISNKDEGRKCVARWANQCIDWCFLRYEDGKMCDQMYLNEWPIRYKKVNILSIGVNVAPWNISGMNLNKRNGQLWVDEQKMLSYHFHQFQIYSVNSFEESTGYLISHRAKKLIYKVYEEDIEKAIKQVRTVVPEFSYGFYNPGKISRMGQELKKFAAVVYWKISNYGNLTSAPK